MTHLRPASADPVTGDLVPSVLDLLAEGEASGVPGALVTLVEADGGPRSVGAQMAVLADGRWRGHLSGGCVEQAVAAEALAALAAGEDRTLRLGEGSPLIDIRLPCGSGLTLRLSVTRPAGWAAAVLKSLTDRRAVSARIAPAVAADPAGHPTGWTGTEFHRRYRPPVRLLILGSGPEALAVAALARTGGLETLLLASRREVAERAEAAGLPVRALTAPACPPELVDDATAVLCLTHEAEWDVPFLAQALATPAVHVGALGSPRTHALRLEALAALGVPPERTARVRSPVGAVPATRDSRSLAFSVLAEVTAVATEHGLTGA